MHPIYTPSMTRSPSGCRWSWAMGPPCRARLVDALPQLYGPSHSRLPRCLGLQPYLLAPVRVVTQRATRSRLAAALLCCCSKPITRFRSRAFAILCSVPRLIWWRPLSIREICEWLVPTKSASFCWESPLSVRYLISSHAISRKGLAAPAGGGTPHFERRVCRLLLGPLRR